MDGRQLAGELLDENPVYRPHCTPIAGHTILMIIDSTGWKRSTLVALELALRFAPWLCVFGIAVLSLVPGEARPHTGLPGQAEHFMAYFLTALFLGIRPRYLVWRILLALALCLYAGLLEVLQIWVPGRSAQLIDFAASSCGALSGMIVVAMLLRFRGAGTK
jgi:hypothetical protein